MDKDILQLEKNIGIKFKNVDLLRQAMVHRSYINENKDFERKFIIIPPLILAYR